LSTAHLATGVLAAVSALGVPAGATSTCSHDTAGAMLNVQMLAPRVVIRAAGGRVLIDGRDCGAKATTTTIVVASEYPPAPDSVVVDERHGPLPKIFALTGAGADTLEVLGTSGRDNYRALDDVGASVDLNGDGDPDVLSTDAARVVLRGGPGNDVLRASRSGEDRLDGGPGNDRILARGVAGDTLIGGSGLDSVRADAGDVVIGFERREQP
jgi:hemolysin type calcium-binding protein